MSEHGQGPQYNPTFMQSTTLAPAPIVINVFSNESHKAKSSESIDQDKMEVIEAKIRVIVGVDLYDPIRAAEMCLVPNVVVLSSFVFLTHLKSYCKKMAEVVHDEKLLMHFFQDSLSGAPLSWFIRLDNIKIQRWKDLVDAFIKQYK